MTLTLIYGKNDHMYKKNFRSYKDMDKFIEQIKKKGYKVIGGDFYK